MFGKEIGLFYEENLKPKLTPKVFASVVLSLIVFCLWTMPLKVLEKSGKGHLMNYFSVAFVFVVAVNVIGLILNLYLKLDELCGRRFDSSKVHTFLHCLTVFGASPANTAAMVVLQYRIMDSNHQSVAIKLIVFHIISVVFIYIAFYFCS